jgi:cob(I)alamin adenosyltransferase
MSEEKILELVTEERKFLHDISNHIVVAAGMVNFAHRVLKTNPTVEAKEIERLEKAMDAIAKMTEKLKERRELLHSHSNS